MKIGMDILLKEEHVQIDSILGHGGLFKTKGVAQGFLAAAINAPVSVMETAGEGGPWGMALMAAYMAVSYTHLGYTVYEGEVAVCEAPEDPESRILPVRKYASK